MRVDRVAKNLEWLGKPINEDDKNLATMSGLSQEYVAERRMLKDDDDELTRTHTEKVITSEYKRL